MKKLFRTLALTLALSMAGLGMTTAYAYSAADVIIGTERPWLFFGSKEDGQALSIYQHTNPYTAEELQEIAAELEGFRQELAAEGIAFVLMIAPDKETIYGMDYMPPEYPVMPGPSCTEQLVEYLRVAAPELQVVYPKDELLAQKQNLAGIANLYYENDTHWNNIGGFFAAEKLLEVIGQSTGHPYVQAPMPDFAFAGMNTDGDLQTFASLGAEYNSPMYTSGILNAGTANVTVTEKIQKGVDPVWMRTVSTAEGAMPVKVLFAGDSFRGAMMGDLWLKVQELITTNRFYLNTDWLLEEKPDVLVYEFVERYVKEMPTIVGYNTSFLPLPRE